MTRPDAEAAAMADDLAAWRRALHQAPELGYAETRTAAFVAGLLRDFGLDAVETGVGGTGVVGVLHGRRGPGGPARSVLFRADMDALPIEEATGLPWASRTPGVMHACGHDGHTAMLLGAARLLARTRAFDGTVVFVFQPAEETGAGAAAMLRDGLLERFPARAAFGMHTAPGLPVGAFAARAGAVMAMTDEFGVTIEGRGGHAAMPHDCRDPIVAGAALVQALQSVVSRSVDPLQPAVLSITQFQGGTARNVIPDRVALGGTIRAFSAEVHALIRDRIAAQCAAVAAAFDVAIRFEPSPEPYPALVNDPGAVALALAALDAAPAMAAIREFPAVMAGEDFAYLARARPSAFVFIGNGDSAPLHHPGYDFNDAAAPWGVAFWTRLAAAALPPAAPIRPAAAQPPHNL